MIDWAWIASHLDELAYRTGQHLYLTAIALAIGFVISFALALLSVRRRAAYGPVVAVSDVIFTIPSLALFAALISVTGITLVTAEVPLVLYTLLIFIRNIVAGFDSVPAEVLEAAAGMGFGGSQRLWRVELPLAVPLLIAGLRLASVSTIGLVTITATIGINFGGLGFFILEGYQRGFPTEILAGAVLSICLAIGADILFVGVQRRATPWARARARGSAA